MVDIESSFIDPSGELVLGEYTVGKEGLDYLTSPGITREEAIRALTDMGAAAVLVEGKNFSKMYKFIGMTETPPIKLNNGLTIPSPGKPITNGIYAAEALNSPHHWRRMSTKRAMGRAGLTAQTVRER